MNEVPRHCILVRRDTSSCWAQPSLCTWSDDQVAAELSDKLIPHMDEYSLSYRYCVNTIDRWIRHWYIELKVKCLPALQGATRCSGELPTVKRHRFFSWCLSSVLHSLHCRVTGKCKASPAVSRNVVHGVLHTLNLKKQYGFQISHMYISPWDGMKFKEQLIGCAHEISSLIV
jgi:hypothetical protein